MICSLFSPAKIQLYSQSIIKIIVSLPHLLMFNAKFMDMKKLIIANILFFAAFFCFGQDVDDTEILIQEPDTIEVAHEDLFMEDFISFRGKKYTVAMADEVAAFMVSDKHLEREIGVVEEHTEVYFEDITTELQIISCSWDKGTKLYKIKQIDATKYIAVEWVDKLSGNKYYVYCHQRDMNAERQLHKFLKELRK